ncbi:hypothetical protein [Effusibacillus consociatus]|uniref:Uncharacterized protein n=1 Tax=Effusibacillus consociatus TaxID=1117041 RepID=A0ABV9Q5K2_9BACL
MKELVKLWIVSKVISEVMSLIGILFCAGTVVWIVFSLLPTAIGEVFGF